MAFNNYLEDENDKPYFTTNSLAYYYDKMEGFAKAVDGSVKALNLTKEEVEKRLTLYIEQNKNELDQRLAQWDGKIETLDSTVETLLSEWVDDGTLTHVIDSTLIDQKIAPLAGQLAGTIKEVNGVAPVNGKVVIEVPQSFLTISNMAKPETVFLNSASTFWKGNLFAVKKNIYLREMRVDPSGTPTQWQLWEYDNAGLVLSNKVAFGSFDNTLMDSQGYLRARLSDYLLLSSSKVYILIVKYSTANSKYVAFLNNGMNNEYMMALEGIYNLAVEPVVGATLGGSPNMYVYDYKFMFTDVKTVASTAVLPSTPIQSTTSKWAGKTWVVFGDSNSKEEDAYPKYHHIISSQNNMTLHNYAVSGGGWKQSSTLSIDSKVDGAAINADLITFMAGGNDVASVESGSLPLGVFGDATMSTFYGALDYTIGRIVAKYPTKTIGAMAQMKRGNDKGSPVVIQNMVKALKDVCGKYGIPVLDLYNAGNIHAYNTTFLSTYMPDGVHLNALAHEKVLEPKVAPWLESI